jgi:cell division protein ZapA (FtsZ GTPase activity inhibitor)
MKDWKEIKSLPIYLQPKILSAVAYINSAAPNMSKSVERINTLSKHLSDKEMTYVMSLLVFDKLIDMVKDSDEFKNHTTTMKARTLQ